MKSTPKVYLLLMAIFSFFLVSGLAIGTTHSPAFEPLKGDMSNFDPDNQVFPTTGDTIKIGIFWPFSGPAAVNGQIFWMTIGLAVHDINSQGGIMVDGKMKKIQMIKGDHQMDPNAAKRAAEKLCLEDKVDVIIGTTGTHLNIVGQQVAAKYKKIYMNVAALSDLLMDGKNFNRYTFRTVCPTSIYGRALAYYYSKRPEKNFYILCQDYAYGHEVAEGFKKALKEFKPDAQIVGEDYHPLFAKDFAPYLSKIQGSQAEVIITGDYLPDSGNLLKQKQQIGLKIPAAGIFLDDPNTLKSLGGPEGAGNVVTHEWMADLDMPVQAKLAEIWNKQWKTWKPPLYNSLLFKWPGGILGSSTISTYWLCDVIQRAGSTDPEKIIKTWEGDKYSFFGRTLEMRPCDHQGLQDMFVSDLIFPNPFYDDAAAVKPKPEVVPLKFVTPEMAPDLDRCKK